MELKLNPFSAPDASDLAWHVTFDVLGDLTGRAALLLGVQDIRGSVVFVALNATSEGGAYVVVWPSDAELDITDIALWLCETACGVLGQPAIVTYVDDDHDRWQIDADSSEPWKTYAAASDTTFHTREEWEGWAHGSGRPTPC